MNKTTVCRHFNWTRYEFDQAVADGMPVVEMAAHKGGEWKVSLDAADRWVREKQEREAERERRLAEQWRREQEETKRWYANLTPEQRERLKRRR